MLYAGNLRSCKAENSSKNNLNNKSVRFGHFSTYIKNNLGRAISFVYNDFTDTVSAGPKGGRLKETKCQESSKPLGQVEDEIMKTGAQFVGEEILKKIQKKKKLKRKDLIPVLLSPLMGGKSEIKTRILEGIKAVNREDKLISI